MGSSRQGAAFCHVRCLERQLARLVLHPGWCKTALETPVFFGCSSGSVWLHASRTGRYTPRRLRGCASPLHILNIISLVPRDVTCCGRPRRWLVPSWSKGHCWWLSAGP